MRTQTETQFIIEQKKKFVKGWTFKFADTDSSRFYKLDHDRILSLSRHSNLAFHECNVEKIGKNSLLCYDAIFGKIFKRRIYFKDMIFEEHER